MATVTYGMPPEGYDTLTLPSNVYEHLMDRARQNHRTPSEELKQLLDNGGGSDDASLADIQAAVETIETRTGRIEQTLDDLGGA